MCQYFESCSCGLVTHREVLEVKGIIGCEMVQIVRFDPLPFVLIQRC